MPGAYATRGDLTVWALNPGDCLISQDDLYMDCDPDGERLFTKGEGYTVIHILPLRTPAAAVVVDDTGTENKIEPDFLAAHFRVERGTAS